MTEAMQPNPSLSVVIPAYNEQESLEDTVKAIVAALPEPARSQLVIVIPRVIRGRTGPHFRSRSSCSEGSMRPASG